MPKEVNFTSCSDQDGVTRTSLILFMLGDDMSRSRDGEVGVLASGTARGAEDDSQSLEHGSGPRSGSGPGALERALLKAKGQSSTSSARCVSVASDHSMGKPVYFKEKEESSDEWVSMNCVSMKSDHSKGTPEYFKQDAGSSDQRVDQLRSDPPGPSCVSMKSDHSKGTPVYFKQDKESSDPRLDQLWSDPPGPSCVSINSDHSKRAPVYFKQDKEPSDPRVDQLRSHPPRPSCVSMKSDRSKGTPENFKQDKDSSDQRVAQSRLDPQGPSYVSMESDHSKGTRVYFKQDEESSDQRASGGCEAAMSTQSIDRLLELRGRNHQSADQQGSDVLQQNHQLKEHELLEENIMGFVRNELRRLFSGLGPEDFGCQREDGAALDAEDEEQMRRSREAVLRVTIHFLKMTRKTALAERLQSRTSAPSVQDKLKSTLRKKFQCVFDSIAKAGSPTPLNQIFTELYITEGGSSDVNREHEVRQIETTSRIPARPETTIRKEDIFKGSPGQNRPVRTVLTKGVAGIGKTVLTQKFTLDWAERKTNQDIQLMFPFTFRELNIHKERKFSLVGLIHHFFVDIKDAGIHNFEDFQVAFIFDGLDECRFSVDPRSNPTLTDATQPASVAVLLSNLISGNLLPSAHIWITARPAAAALVRPDCVGMVTEVRGFSDSQKEEYFKKRFKDPEQARTIISHIKTSRSLHIMCHIPVFCYISSTVLEEVLKNRHGGKLPKTLTEMYIHFLVVQSKVKMVRYDGGSETDLPWNPENRKMIESLAKLAYEQLLGDRLIFYEEDLVKSGINIEAASMYSGVFTQIFREETSLSQEKVFCFVHLSIQEFLAALHVHLSFISRGFNVLTSESVHGVFGGRPKLAQLHKRAVKKALQSANGHLDLLLRFLLGLSLQTNQNLLRGLHEEMGGGSESSQETIKYIKKKIANSVSAERSINLFHCLNELNDQFLMKEIQEQVRSGHLSIYKLSPAQWAALVFILLSSEEDLDMFDLKKYSASEEALLRLLPVVRASNKALLAACNLSEKSCESLSTIISSQVSCLRELDLSNNNLQDSGVKHLCAGLESPQSRLETLRLRLCKLSEVSCETLSQVLSRSLSLRELDLSNNLLQDSGVRRLSGGLRSPHCHLETLRLAGCNLSGRSCSTLSALFVSQSPTLRELDLSNNDLQDSGVKLLSAGLESQHCRLETLILSGCMIAEEGCAALAVALRSSGLKKLDLSYNHPGDPPPRLRLGSLRVDHGGKQRLKPSLRKYYCELTMDPNTVNRELKLSDNNRKVTSMKDYQSYPKTPERFDCCQLLCSTGLTGRCYWEVEWKGDVHIAASYGQIARKGTGDECVFGQNSQSWSLRCSDYGYYVHHEGQATSVMTPQVSHRVAVFVDYPAGTLSFFRISSDMLVHLHTFNTTFTDAVYPGFAFKAWPGSSATLCRL